MILTNIEQACKIMNISVPGQNVEPGQTTFSDDVLKIELCGPSRENLSIIDIPGIFRTPTEGVTTKIDMALVEKMVWDYIRDERTVILAVLPAPTDIATQSILTMAKADPDGLRTMGVLTKPDLVDKGAEQGIIDLVMGKRHPLRLGYCIVRNRGQAELNTASSERSAVESHFFNQTPWSTLDKDRVGLLALKERLQELLVEITQREFPKLKSQIDQRLAACKGKLADLGPDRTSQEQQRRYLQEMAIEYQKLTDYAVDVYYNRNPVFDEIPALRLPTLIVERNDAYIKEISRRGHTIDFNLPEEETAATSESDASEGFDEEITEDPTDVSCILPISDEDNECSELCDLFPVDFVIPHTRGGNVLGWIEKEYRKARGRSLESIGPAVIPTLWQQQSKNLEAITLHYFRDVITYVHKFICKLLCHVCPNDRTRNSLFSIIIDPLLERYHNAINHVKFVIKVERFGIPLTQNHYFSDNLQKFRVDKVKKALESAARADPTERCVGLEKAITLAPIGNVEQTILDIHAILKSYYKVARKRFVDTVCMQGTDYHLLSSDDSPLRIFSPLFVSSLTNGQLESIAGEDPSSKRLRKTPKLEIEALEDGKKLLRTV